jgi:hypothetical protein
METLVTPAKRRDSSEVPGTQDIFCQAVLAAFICVMIYGTFDPNAIGATLIFLVMVPVSTVILLEKKARNTLTNSSKTNSESPNPPSDFTNHS